MIDIDGTAPLTPGRLVQLVEAVVKADHEDESAWVEWKSELDLNTRHGQFTLAKAILGFANRDPRLCTQPFAGTGYVIVGAEPGLANGIERVDLADLHPRLARYLGSPGPLWRHHYIPLPHAPARSVLVVEIPAPRPGEMGYPLAAEGVESGPKATSAPSGTLFVRRGSKTDRANYNETMMLFERAAQGAAPVKISDLDVKAIIIADDTLRVLDVSESAVDDWLERRRQHLLAETVEDAGRHLGLTRRWSDYEIRIYSQSVDAYLEACRPYVAGALTAAFLRQGYNSFSIHVVNRSDEHLADVEVILTLPPGCIVVDPSQVQLARLPDPDLVQLAGFGSPGQPDTARFTITAPIDAVPRHAQVTASRRCIDIGTRVTYTESLGDVRAQASTHSCTIQVLIEGTSAELEVGISVTSPSIPGRTQESAPVRLVRTDTDFHLGLIGPDPKNPGIPTRKFPLTHAHHHEHR